jgi:Capsule assembly protein Wzi
VRIRTSLFFAAPALLVVVSTLSAQTQPTPSPPGSAPVPTPEQTIPSVPPPTQEPPPTIPASATPESVGKPVVPPTQPTPQAPYTAYDAYAPDLKPPPDRLGSVYITVDSWVYPALNRLYGMGFVDTMYLSMRPYTRRSVLHMLLKSQDEILSSNNEQAVDILAKLLTFLSTEVPDGNVPRGLVYGLDSSYTRVIGIGGPVLVDSYHLGQTISNDYGRPYQTGFNSIVGASTVNEWGPFSLYVRGEYQHAPSAVGYSQDLADQLAFIDQITQTGFKGPLTTTPLGPIPQQDPFRLVEAYASVYLFGHEISGGKSDHWLGPAAGSSMAWSNNAENTYSFEINRVEPLSIPLLSKLLGPVRYDFFVGSLKGHMVPRSPWVHAFMFSFRPTDNLEFSFERTVIWGGAGHAPVTLHTFLRSFFDVNDTVGDEKQGRDDPGARFSDFSLSYRLPLMRKYMSFYVDSISHDDVTPISAPRRASYRTGLYLSQIPKLNKFDLRVEAVSTDPAVTPAAKGEFAYWETIQLQGYTNKGIIMGDWIGREAKGGQARLTYHLSGNEWIQLDYLNKKTPFNFVTGGTTQNQFKLNVVKRLGKEVELNAWYQHEGWKAPIYMQGLQTNNAVSVQLTWYPKLSTYPAQR